MGLPRMLIANAPLNYSLLIGIEGSYPSYCNDEIAHVLVCRAASNYDSGAAGMATLEGV